MRRTAILITIVLVAVILAIFLMRRVDDLPFGTNDPVIAPDSPPAVAEYVISKRCVIAYSGMVDRDSLAHALARAYSGVAEHIELMLIRGDKPDTIFTLKPTTASIVAALPSEDVRPITWGQLSQILRGSMVSAQRPPVRDSTVICFVGALPVTPEIVHSLDDKDLRILSKKDFDYLKTSTYARFIFVEVDARRASNTDRDFRMALDAAGIPWTSVSFSTN